jgi:thioredoxin 1
MIDGYEGKIKFCYVDIQQAPSTAQKFAVRSVPTLILFKDGAPAGSLIGAQPKGKIESLLDSA